MAPEDLWELHGGSLVALARTLLGDESAARRAVSSGLTTLYQDQGDPDETTALMLALCIFGGYTYRDAAAALGFSADTGLLLMTTALHHSR